MKNESELEAFLLREVKRRGGKALKLKFINTAGAPDRIILIPGYRPAFMELKNPNGDGVVSAQQHHWIDQLRLHGAIAGVVANVSELMAFINAMEPL